MELESNLLPYTAGSSDHEHAGHGLTLVLPLVLVFATGLFVGRILAKKQDLKRYQERLDNLVLSIESHKKKIGKGHIWKLRTECFLKIYVMSAGVLCALGVYMGYLPHLLHCYEIPLGALLCGALIYLIRKALMFKIVYTTELVQLLELELVQSKRDLMKELGSELIQELKASEKCNKLCEERKLGLEQDLGRHQWLVKELSRFTWCEGCSKESKCTEDCGGKYWRYTKECLRKFHMMRASSSTVANRDG